MGRVFPAQGPGARREGTQPLHSQTLHLSPPPPTRWKIPFDPKHTEQAEFHVSDNKTVEVPMMTLDLETPYFRDEELGCTLVELMYTSNDSALFILPDEGKMQDLEAKLIPETLKRWRNSLQPR